MGLSLYILLLAFFIALTSLFDISPQRADSVMISVKESFYKSSLIGENLDGGGNPAQIGQAGLLPEQQVKKLMGKSLGNLKIEERVNPDGRFQLAATLTQTLFENYLDAFATELSRIINNPDLSSVFETEIVIEAGYQQRQLLDMILQKFAENNYPMPKLSVGLTGKENGRDVTLKFIFEKNYNAFDNFDSSVPDETEAQ